MKNSVAYKIKSVYAVICYSYLSFSGVTGSEYVKFNDVLYQYYILSFVGDFDYNTMKKVNKLQAQIFTGAYFVLVCLICLNIYIAVLSEAFSRVYSFAKATSSLIQARSLINMERNLPELRRQFEIYINECCAPLVKLFSSF